MLWWYFAETHDAIWLWTEILKVIGNPESEWRYKQSNLMDTLPKIFANLDSVQKVHFEEMIDDLI